MTFAPPNSSFYGQRREEDSSRDRPCYSDVLSSSSDKAAGKKLQKKLQKRPTQRIGKKRKKSRAEGEYYGIPWADIVGPGAERDEKLRPTDWKDWCWAKLRLWKQQLDLFWERLKIGIRGRFWMGERDALLSTGEDTASKDEDRAGREEKVQEIDFDDFIKELRVKFS